MERQPVTVATTATAKKASIGSFDILVWFSLIFMFRSVFGYYSGEIGFFY
jgi:hypothetical protein